MNLIELQEKYNTHAKCIAHLEKVRWNGKPVCPNCESTAVTKRSKNEERNTPMYHCNGCNKDFTVLKGTIFEGSKMPLQKWFMLISLMLHAKKGISAMQISRDIGITYKSAWYSAMRVRCAMLDQADMLEGVVEMDEAYIGGKFRNRKGKSNVANISYKEIEGDAWKNKRKGRSPVENKVAVVGIVERGKKGRVVMNVKENLRSDDLLKMLKRYVNTKEDKTVIMTDEYNGYKSFDKVMQHFTVNHSKKEYVKHLKGINHSIHTNTIEGVWSIIKNGIRGQYHVLSKKYLPFYLSEAAYKYSRRNDTSKMTFAETVDNAVNEEKCTVNNKPKAHPSFLANKRRKKKVSNGKK